MTDNPSQRKVKLLLALGLVCLSFPAILIRYADAPPVMIAFWRKLMAAGILFPLLAWQVRRGRFKPASITALLPFILGTGLILALHFTTWITAVKMTTVASSLVLASTQPVWAALLGVVLLREGVPKRGIAAIVISLLGVCLVASGDWDLGPKGLAGDGLAVAAAVFGALYLTAGRHVRERLPLAPWMFSLYITAAAFLGAGAALAGIPFTGYNGRTWLMIALLALIPSTLGHNLINYAVRHMEAYRVNVSILVEPVVSTVLAAFLFAEYPGSLFYAGAPLTLLGVWLALRR